MPSAVHDADAPRVLFFEWKAASRAGNVDDGVDTCLVGGGVIRVHTVRSTLRPPA